MVIVKYFEFFLIGSFFFFFLSFIFYRDRDSDGPQTLNFNLQHMYDLYYYYYLLEAYTITSNLIGISYMTVGWSIRSWTSVCWPFLSPWKVFLMKFSSPFTFLSLSSQCYFCLFMYKKIFLSNYSVFPMSCKHLL